MKAILLLVLALVAVAPAFGETLLRDIGSRQVDWIDLPRGYRWTEYQGDDSTVGEIVRPKREPIHFDMGMCAGIQVGPEPGADQDWLRTTTNVLGQEMRVAYASRYDALTVTIPELFANFMCHVASEAEIPAIVEMLRTFDNEKYSKSFSKHPIYGYRKALRNKRPL